MGAACSPRMQLFLGPGHLTHKVPEFKLHKHAASPNGVKHLLFQKTDARKKQTIGTIQGRMWSERYKSGRTQLEAITQWDEKGELET